MRPKQTIFVVFSFVALIGSCATEPPPRPVALDPSNPAASESPPPVITSLARSEAPARAVASPAGEKPANQDPTIYTCSMHPEVTADKPGRCPKCGMDLVPRSKEKK
jgi:hypothetical protein